MATKAAAPLTDGTAGKVAMETLASKLTRQLAMNMHACVHCGLCFESCHYYLATGDPTVTPAYKAEQLRKLYKRRFDWMGRLFPWWVQAKKPTEEQLAKLYDAAFGSCTMCRRCNFSCPMGLDMGLIMRTARSILAPLGRIPEGLKETVDVHLETGNNMGISKEDFIETVEWMEEEVQRAVGDPNFKIPVDKPGVKKLMCFNPREVKFYPLLFLAQYKTAYAAGDEWGICSDAWAAIYFIRSQHDRTGFAPTREELCTGLGFTKKQFYGLFPGTYRTALRVAGMPSSQDTGEPAEEKAEEAALP